MVIDWWLVFAVFLYFASAALIVAEVFVPSGGLISVCSLGCVIGGVYIFFSYSAVAGWIGIVIAMVMIPAALIATYKVLPKTEIGKMLLLTPGIDRKTKEYEEWGISGSILGRFMRSRGIVPEKTDFNLILFLLTPGLEHSKAGSLLAALVEFKRLFDDNAPVGEVLPGLPKEYPGRYDALGIQEVAQGLHDLLRKFEAKRLQREIFQVTRT